jgi:hypothetical protein
MTGDRIKYGLSPLWAETHSLYEGSYSTSTPPREQNRFPFSRNFRTCIHWLNIHLTYSTVVPDIYSWEFNWYKDSAFVNRALYSAVHRGKEKKLLEIRVHLVQVSSDIRLDLTGDGVAMLLEPPSSSAAGRLWTVLEFLRVGEVGPVP